MSWSVTILFATTFLIQYLDGKRMRDLEKTVYKETKPPFKKLFTRKSRS